MRKRNHQLFAAAGAATIAALSVFGSTAAHAAPDDYGNIEADFGSLTIHKFLHQSGAPEGDISDGSTAGAFTDPVAGVEFTAYPLIKAGDTDPLDLTIPASWEALAGVTAGANCVAPAGFTLGAPVVFPLTNASGASTSVLDLGAYQVCETGAPPHIVDTAAPFLVTVPMPHENGWVYDVHAYPKNGAAGIQKTIVAQEGLGLGASVQFPVSTTIPTMKGQSWTAYSISDTFDDRLAVNPATQGVASVTIDGVDLDPSYYDTIVDGQTVVMEFTAAGIAWLNEDPDQTGKVIEVVFDSVITEVGDGSIENEAQLWVNDPSRAGDPVPSNEVHTNWGSLEILKLAVGTSAPAGALSGAEFEVYAAAAPYADDCTEATPMGDPITVGTSTTFTSDANGVVNISGLFVSDSENPVMDAEQRCYVLKEVAAPAGYILPANGAEFTGVAVKIGDTTTADNAEIENTQQPAFQLPVTGGSGTAVLMTLGVGGLSVATGLALMKRRRKDAATPAA